MSSIYKDFTGINQLVMVTFRKDMRKDLFEKVCVFETPGIVLAESGKVRHLVVHI